MNSTLKIINHLLNLPKKSDRVFVFDIDSTLYNVTPRNQEIVRHFAQTKPIDENLKSILLNFELNSDDWGIKPGLMRILKESPEEALIKSIKKHWNEYFFSADFLHLDEIYPGALEFVKSLDLISPVYYLTGRDVKRMGTGTEVQLKNSGFPLSQKRNKLILKPDQNILDHQYKLDELLVLKNQFSEIHFFENEPLILNTVFESTPDIHLYYIDSVNSGRAEINPNIKVLKPHYR